MPRKSGYTITALPDHKIWIEQCAAARRIREHFGLEKALVYLIGQKLFTFIGSSEQNAAFDGELPAFVAEIRRVFSDEEINAYLPHLKRTHTFVGYPELR